MMCPKCGEVINAHTAVGARVAMKFHRKYKCPKRDGRKIPLSIQENAQQLIQHGDQVAEGVIGVNTLAGDAVNAVVERLEQVKDQIEGTSQTAATLLGEGHAGVSAVTGSAAVVVEKIIELQGQAKALQQGITGLDQLIIAHADAMREAGQKAMGQG